MPLIDINNGQRQIEAAAGQKLLAALAAADIVLPSACGGRGRCGMCRTRVFTELGNYTGMELQRLSAEQLSNKWRLACQVEITRDIAIELPGQLTGATQFVCQVAALEDLTYDIKRVRLALPPAKRVLFKAGQYMQLTAPAYGAMKRAVYRAYSLALPPSEAAFLEFFIRRVPNGVVTTYVHEHLRVGDEVTVTGPYGDFYLRDSDRELVLIAGGSGLSPVRSIIYDMLERQITRRATVFFGACKAADLYCVEEFQKLAAAHEWLSYVPALSDERQNDCASGLITEVVDKHYTALDNHEGYLCGGPGMIKACQAVLTAKGMPENLIFYDEFA